jgi:anti-sigma B factor antagonist
MTERRFAVAGEIDTANATELQSKLLVLVNATGDDLVLDCAGLEFIDSTGIAVFIHIQQLLDIQGRGFRVVNLNDMPLRAFQLLGLDEDLGLTELGSAQVAKAPSRGVGRCCPQAPTGPSFDNTCGRPGSGFAMPTQRPESRRAASQYSCSSKPTS